MWSEVLTPNREARWPWTDHVQSLSELPSDALKEAVEFDRHLWALAERDPEAAARESVSNQIHYRHGVPRLGEPIFRTPQQAERSQPRMYCDRGTGHLGTGLYFFGTLSAAFHSGYGFAPQLGEMGERELREATAGLVWVIDVSSLSPPDVDERKAWEETHGAVRYLFSEEKVYEYHDFAKNLLCYPSGVAALARMTTELTEAEEAAAVAGKQSDDNPDDDDLWSAAYDLDQEVKRLREHQRRATDTLRGDVRDIDWKAPSREMPPDRESYLAVAPLASRAQAAVDAYVLDVEERRFPGYHPMTYYMRLLNVTAIVHQDWRQHNSGSIGNIWYPWLSDS